MKNYKNLFVIIAILAIFLAPNLTHAFGFHGVDGGCPILFDVQFGDPAEYAIKAISRQVGVSNFESEVDEDGDTTVTWRVNDPHTSEQFAVALFGKRMRLIGLSIVAKTYEIKYFDELITNMMKSLGNIDNPEVEVQVLRSESTAFTVRFICAGKIGYEFEVDLFETPDGNTLGIVSVVMIDLVR